MTLVEKYESFCKLAKVPKEEVGNVRIFIIMEGYTSLPANFEEVLENDYGYVMFPDGTESKFGRVTDVKDQGIAPNGIRNWSLTLDFLDEND